MATRVSRAGTRLAAGVRQDDLTVFGLSLPLLALSAVAVWLTADPVWRVPALIALVVMHLSLLVRASMPWVTFAATGIGALILLLGPFIPASATRLPGAVPGLVLPSGWLFGVAIYSVAAHARTSRWLAVVLGIAGVAELTASLWAGLPWFLAPTSGLVAWRVVVALVGLALVFLAFALGRWRALSAVSDDLGLRWRSLAGEHDTVHLDHAVTQQQTRMAREVQEAVARNLDEILERARDGRRDARRAPALADDALADITFQGEEALGRVHSLLALLDDPDPEELLTRDPQAPVLAQEHALSPQPQLEDLPKLIDAARGEGTAVTLEVDGERGDLAVAAQLALYRTVQEALTNTVRHAGPGAVAYVQLDWGADDVSVTVEDESPGEGDGLDESLFSQDYVEGRGLRVVRERLETLGGHLEVDPLDRGYRVRGVVPRDARSPLG